MLLASLWISAVTLRKSQLAKRITRRAGADLALAPARARRPDNGRVICAGVSGNLRWRFRRRPPSARGQMASGQTASRRGMPRGGGGGATAAIRARAASGPGRTLRAEHQVHGLAA